MKPKRFRVRVSVVNDELSIPLPEAIRDELGLRDGDELDMHIEPGRITLTPLPKGPATPSV